jgi:hypothetical protein
MGVQKLISIKYPSATLYPPVHQDLKLYSRLLRNIPLRSADDYQKFLDATSQIENTGDTNPFNSTQTSQGRGKSFWRKFSFTKKPSPRVNPPEDNLPGIAMSDLMRSNPSLPTAVENDPSSSELNAILTVH